MSQKKPTVLPILMVTFGEPLGRRGSPRLPPPLKDFFSLNTTFSTIFSTGLSLYTIFSFPGTQTYFSTIFSLFTLTIPQVMLLEAFLSFLGLGIQPPMSSWGTLIRYGVESMEEYSWLLVFPGITFTITLFSLNFFGDGLRDALEPKTSSD